MKKAVIFSLDNKPVICVGVCELATDEYIRIQKECEKNLQEFINNRNEILRELDYLKGQVLILKNQIKILRGE